MLDQYLCGLKKQLVDEWEAQKPDAGVDGASLDLASELARLFPMKHAGILGAMDKAHVCWARCLRDALCLGWISEAKHNRRNADGQRIYSDEIYAEIEKSIHIAFIIGRKYAQERP